MGFLTSSCGTVGYNRRIIMLRVLGGRMIRDWFICISEDFGEIFKVAKKDLVLGQIIIHRTAILRAAGRETQALKIIGLIRGPGRF